MSGWRTRRLLLPLVVLVAVSVALVAFGVFPLPWDDERATVRIEGDNGTKATVDAAVADTTYERYVGLSNHDSLEDGEGMLFVHDGEAERTYVMRNMDFGIDIVFVGRDGEITAIHHARAPEPGEDGSELQYSGRAKWVLEVPRGYTNETGVAVGDTVEIDRE